jgi:putative transposase
VVGYALADHLRTELAADALSNAVAARDPGPGVISTSDRGCQDISAQFASLADEHQVTLSLGRTGQCWDNALAETFFASLKGELIDLQPWPTRAIARRAVVEYIAWYNGTRLHSTLSYGSPAQFKEDNKIRNVAGPNHQPCPSKRGNPKFVGPMGMTQTTACHFACHLRG